MEKENKKTWLIVAVIAILVVVIVVLLTNFNKSTNNQNQKPNVYMGEYTMKDRVVFEKYLMDNISSISPQKEVLGGKFYVTTIDWTNDRSGMVAYEDGHIALRAEFQFSYADAAGTIPQLDFFNIIPDLSNEPINEEMQFETGQPGNGLTEPGVEEPNTEPSTEPNTGSGSGSSSGSGSGSSGSGSGSSGSSGSSSGSNDDLVTKPGPGLNVGPTIKPGIKPIPGPIVEPEIESIDPGFNPIVNPGIQPIPGPAPEPIIEPIPGPIVEPVFK